MITDAPNLNILWAELIVEELIRNGVDRFIISPGSRSTPLTVAAARNPKAKTTVYRNNILENLMLRDNSYLLTIGQFLAEYNSNFVNLPIITK